jgi:hypothetical protein
VAARARTARKRGFPDNLYERKGYYSYRNPITGEEFGIGRDKAAAFQEAQEANIYLAGLQDKPRLIDRLQGQSDNSWGAWLTEYEKIIGLVESNEHEPTKEFAPNTLKTYRSRMKKIRTVWAEHMGLPIKRIDTRIIADGIKKIRTAMPRMTQSVRSQLLESFDKAIAAGWIEINPVTVTDEIEVKVKRARLTWDLFKTVYEDMPPGRLKNACALALVSGQARETIVAGQFAQAKPLELPGQQPVECWQITRGKTGAKIAIPLDLRLDVFGMSLRDVIRQCRTTGIASKYLVHNTERRRGMRVGGPYEINRLTKDFTAAILALNIDWGKKSPPTFHELRSLSKRLYELQGGVDTLDLLGHADDKTGQIYADPRDAEYRLVSISK